jgi:hypothetical protein
VIEAPERGWGSAGTVLGLAGAAVLVAVFVAVERSVEHPMLDVTLFSDRRFSAAAGAVTIVFFALSGFIFLITQYFQLIREYGPLSTGARILPVAGSIAVASIIGGVLAPRTGTRVLVVTGLMSFGAAMLWIAGVVEVDTPYATVIVAQMVLMGIGIGLIQTPATESIMQVLPPARAGVGSAVNDATRELGATLGVAVVGAVFSSVYGARLAESAFAGTGRAEEAGDSVHVARVVADGDPALLHAVQDSFLSGLSVGCLTVAVVCFVGALAGSFALPGRGFAAPSDAVDENDLAQKRDESGSMSHPGDRPQA